MRKLCSFVLMGALATVVACSASDPGITTAVKSKLTTDDTVKAYQIDVDTQGGVVTLTGAVENQAAKDRAVQLARETDSVTRVEDRLTVNPAATADSRAREAGSDAAAATSGAADRAGDAAAGVSAAVKTRLLADPDVAGLRIDVDTTDKVVTLTGTVATAAQKSEAESIARDTTGVTRVVNNLRVGQ